jgi:hypothetical protein
MSFSLIYTKTPKGAEEVRSRNAGLSPSARRVLIMVDGKRDENELRLVVRDGELEGAIASLLAQGMIEECGLIEVPEQDWTDEEDATVAMEAAGLRLDLGVGGAGAAAPLAAAASRASPPPPPTLRMAIEEVDRRTVLAPPAPAAAPTTIVIKPTRPLPGRPPATAAATDEAALEQAKRVAVRALYERLGPYGEEPAARINDCKTHEALRAQIRHACQRITTFRGAPAAREYLAAIGMA